jgi:hypothetical protein
MTYAIRVGKSFGSTEDGSPYLLDKRFNSLEELQAVGKLCHNRRRIYYLESLIIPVRTDNIGNFCKDFFFPGLFEVALRTHNAGVKIFLCIVTTVIDIVFLPIRLITVIPRYIYNATHPKEAHPFYQYLINNGVDKQDLSKGHVYLEFEWIEGRRGLGRFEADLNVTIQGDTFNFMHLPLDVSKRNHLFKRRGI